MTIDSKNIFLQIIWYSRRREEGVLQKNKIFNGKNPENRQYNINIFIINIIFWLRRMKEKLFFAFYNYFIVLFLFLCLILMLMLPAFPSNLIIKTFKRKIEE